MTKKHTFTIFILHRLSPSPYRESWRQLKKGKPGHLIKNTIIRMVNEMRLLKIILRYPPIFRHHLIKLMGSDSAGIDHITLDLVDLIKESIDLNSTAIIFPFKINPQHNFGREADSTPDIYYNLSDSYYVTPTGEKKKIRVIHAKDFLKMWSYYRVRFFCQGKTIPPTKENRKNMINVCHRYSYVKHFKRLPGNVNGELYEYPDGTQIHLRLANVLIKKAESVLQTLGEYYLLRVRMPWDGHIPYSHERLKTEMISWGNQQSYDTLREWAYGEGLHEQLLKIFPRGSNVYIMSNLWRPFDEDYFGPLRRSFKVYRYYDFPELVQLAEGEKCNTGQLKLIEREFQKQSTDSLTLDYRRPITTGQNIQSRFNYFN